MFLKCSLIMSLAVLSLTGCATHPAAPEPQVSGVHCTHTVDASQNFTFDKESGVTKWEDPVHGGSIFVFTRVDGKGTVSRTDKEMVYYTCQGK